MKITVCELPDPSKSFANAWGDLVEHVQAANSGLVVLPDMPFCPWLAHAERFDRNVWASAVRAHDEWEHRLHELSPAIVMASRPVDFGNQRYDEGFIWEEPLGVLSVHAKPYLPEDAAAGEGSYDGAGADFTPVEVRGLRIAMLMGDEMWAPDSYEGATLDVLAIPRAGDHTPFADSLERARALAQHTCAYSLSSNRSGTFGGHAWIVSPEGNVLGITNADQPFLTMDVALQANQPEQRHFDVFAQ